MITAKNLHIYLAAAKPENRAHLEDSLVLDGFEVSSFSSATRILVAVRWLNFIDSLNGSRSANGMAKRVGSFDSPHLTIGTI